MSWIKQRVFSFALLCTVVKYIQLNIEDAFGTNTLLNRILIEEMNLNFFFLNNRMHEKRIISIRKQRQTK